MQTNIPKEIEKTLNGETPEFVVVSSRAFPRKGATILFGIGLFAILIMILFSLAFFFPLLTGQEVNFEVNGTPTTASMNNLGPAIVPACIIGIFSLISIGFTIASLIMIFSKGGIFVGTEKRLISYRKKELISTEWNQFTSTIEIQGDNKKGDIVFTMKTGYSVDQDGNQKQFSPDKKYICGVSEAYDLNQIILNLIKENNTDKK